MGDGNGGEYAGGERREEVVSLLTLMNKSIYHLIIWGSPLYGSLAKYIFIVPCLFKKLLF